MSAFIVEVHRTYRRKFCIIAESKDEAEVEALNIFNPKEAIIVEEDVSSYKWGKENKNE